MNDQTNNSQGFLKDKLGDYQVNPPEKVWESISGRLGSGRSRRGMLIIAFAAAASLALAISLGIHYFGPDLPQESDLAEETAQEEISSPLEEKVLSVMEDAVADESNIPAELEEAPLKLARENQGRTGVKIHIAPDEQSFEEQQTEKDTTVDQLRSTRQDMAPDQNLARDLQGEADRVALEDPEDPAPPEALALEGNDQLPDEAFTEFLEGSKREPRWMLGAAISPLYSFRDAEASVMAGAGVHESGILSYSSGMQVSYRRHSRLAFETGIFFNKTGVAISATGIQLLSQQSDYLVLGNGSERADIKAVTNSVGNIISNTGEIYVNGYKLNAQNSTEALTDNAMEKLASSSSGIEQHLDYLELPFNLRYSVIDRTFELQLVGGLSTNFLVNNYVTMETADGQEEIGYLSNIRNVNYSGNAGLGVIYHVSKNLNLMLEPRFRYFLNSINDSSLPSTRPYSIGLYTSLNFTF
jgi:hypothetical protein